TPDPVTADGAGELTYGEPFAALHLDRLDAGLFDGRRPCGIHSTTVAVYSVEIREAVACTASSKRSQEYRTRPSSAWRCNSSFRAIQIPKRARCFCERSTRSAGS